MTHQSPSHEPKSGLCTFICRNVTIAVSQGTPTVDPTTTYVVCAT